MTTVPSLAGAILIGLTTVRTPWESSGFRRMGPDAVQLPSRYVLTGINEDGVIVGLWSDGDSCPRGDVFLTDSNNLEQREFLGKWTNLGCGTAYGWPVINDQGTVAALINAGRKDMYMYGGYYSAGQWTTMTEERASL